MTVDRKRLAYGGAALVLVGVAALSFRGGSSTQYITSKVLKGSIEDAVEATGTINAIRTVQVGSQVSGTIAKLNADFNTPVHKGEVIALIDPSLFAGALQQANANLEAAKANVVASEAAVEKAKATRVQTKADYDRDSALVRDHVETQQVLDLAKSNYDGAVAGVTAAIAGVTQAKAQVTQAEASVAVAKTNLDYTVIRSPIDGIVVARNVDVGQTVAASLQAPTIFSIAQDMTHMQLYAKTDESDVGRIRTGQAVTFKVDAFPKETFSGKVSQMRMNATTVQNVVTYDCIIDFENPNMKLYPGMTAYVTIPVAQVQNVVKLPNTALRYRPPFSPEELQAVYAKYGIDDTAPAAGAPTAKGPRHESAIVWKLGSGNSIEPASVTLGITDHAFTEVVAVTKGSLQPDDDVVTASLAPKGSTPSVQGVRR